MRGGDDVISYASDLLAIRRALGYVRGMKDHGLTFRAEIARPGGPGDPYIQDRMIDELAAVFLKARRDEMLETIEKVLVAREAETEDLLLQAVGRAVEGKVR